MVSQKGNIVFDSIVMDAHGSTMQQIFARLSREVENVINIQEGQFLNIIMKAQAVSPSGIGNGVALPELQLDSLFRPLCIFMKLSKQVDFKSIDGTPVDLVCLLVSPTKDGALHLKRLSRLTRLLRDNDFCDIVRNTHNSEKIQTLFQEWQRELRLAA